MITFFSILINLKPLISNIPSPIKFPPINPSFFTLAYGTSDVYHKCTYLLFHISILTQSDYSQPFILAQINSLSA